MAKFHSKDSARNGKPYPNENKYERWIRRRCEAGNWFIVFDDYLKILTFEEAWTLQRIINAGRYRPKDRKRLALWNDGWILCTSRFLERKLGLDRKAQARVLRALQGRVKNKPEEPDRRFISTKRVGSPCHRYVKIHHEMIEEAIDRARRAEEEDDGTPKPNPIASRKKQCNASSAKQRDASCTKQEIKNHNMRILPSSKEEEGKEETAAEPRCPSFLFPEYEQDEYGRPRRVVPEGRASAPDSRVRKGKPRYHNKESDEDVF